MSINRLEFNADETDTLFVSSSETYSAVTISQSVIYPSASRSGHRLLTRSLCLISNISAVQFVYHANVGSVGGGHFRVRPRNNNSTSERCGPLKLPGVVSVRCFFPLSTASRSYFFSDQKYGRLSIEPSPEFKSLSPPPSRALRLGSQIGLGGHLNEHAYYGSSTHFFTGALKVMI